MSTETRVSAVITGFAHQEDASQTVGNAIFYLTGIRLDPDEGTSPESSAVRQMFVDQERPFYHISLGLTPIEPYVSVKTQDPWKPERPESYLVLVDTLRTLFPINGILLMSDRDETLLSEGKTRIEDLEIQGKTIEVGRE